MPEARDPNRRWYGGYANYNAPAYNTKFVKASDLPKTYDEFVSHKEWAGKIAIDDTDDEWLSAIYSFYGEERGKKLVQDIVTNLKPIITDGHLALARSVGAGEYWLSLNNYVPLTLNVKMAGGPIDFWALDPVALIFGSVGISALAPHPERRAARGEFRAQPGGREIHDHQGPPADPRRCADQSARRRRNPAPQENHPRHLQRRGAEDVADALQGPVRIALIPVPDHGIVPLPGRHAAQCEFPSGVTDEALPLR